MSVFTFYNSTVYVNGTPVNERKFMDADELSFFFDAIDKSPVWGKLLKYTPPAKNKAVAL